MRLTFILTLSLYLFFYSCKNKPSTSDSANNYNEGQTVYNQYCLSCHQANGTGVPGMYPTLRQTDIIAGDKKTLIKLILTGSNGGITVNGETFNAIMPPQNNLTDEQIANVLSYVRKSFGNNEDSVLIYEVKETRDSMVNSE